MLTRTASYVDSECVHSGWLALIHKSLGDLVYLVAANAKIAVTKLGCHAISSYEVPHGLLSS